MDAQTLRKTLKYDRESGRFEWLPREGEHWRIRRHNTIHAGTEAGGPDGKGYTRIKIRGKIYRAHRLAWLYEYGEWPSREIDHINRKRPDNRISNLRLATTMQNGGNQTIASNNSSGVKGVYWEARVSKWRARIRVNDKLIHLGTFSKLESAAAAYLCAANENFGEFATDGKIAA